MDDFGAAEPEDQVLPHETSRWAPRQGGLAVPTEGSMGIYLNFCHASVLSAY
ncbi:MAG: hypothetical protein ACTIJJ_14085 [Galactobacter sp.]